MSRSGMSPEIPLSEISVFADGLDHPECVCWHPDGHLYAGGEAGQIYRISHDGRRVEEIARTGGFVLGLAVSNDGSWLAACDYKQQCVWRYDLDPGRLSLLSRGTDSCHMQIPNHLVFDRHGRLFVSDSGAAEKPSGRIFQVTPEGDTSVWHDGPFHFANGVAVSPSQDALFVVCSWASTVEKIDISPDGAAGARSIYLTLDRALPDGLAFSPEGELFIACYTPSQIYRVIPGGPPRVFLYADDWTDHQLCHPTNICFGGSNRETLFIANLGRWHIASIKSRGVSTR